MQLKKLLLATSLLTIAASQSFAADMPVKAAPVPVAAPVYNWTGFYIGGNVGWAWGDSDLSLTTNLGPTLPISSRFINANQPTNLSDNGFTGGGQIGYNWQTGNWVFGWEVDFNGLDLSKSFAVPPTTVPGVGPQIALNAEISADWFSTMRARIGWASGPWLAYVTGGAAVARLSLNENVQLVGATGWPASHSDTKWGWTLGGGIEWALGTNWTAKIEYLHIDLGGVDAFGSNVGPILVANSSVSYHADLRADIVRFGLNYRFDWGKAPVVAKY